MVRHLYFDQLETLASVGGYDIVTRLSNMTGVFLLSACVVLREKWLWQTPLEKISDTEYQNIIKMIEQTEYELMTSFSIGQVISTVTDMSGNDWLLPMDGTVVDGTQYPELLASVPASWVAGSDITLPNMTEKGVFGENGNVGNIIGENAVQLGISEIPSHTHIQDAHSHSEVIPVVSPALGGEIPATASIVVASPSATGLTIAVNNNTGGDGSHNNIQESLTVYWWIVAR